MSLKEYATIGSIVLATLVGCSRPAIPLAEGVERMSKFYGHDAIVRAYDDSGECAEIRVGRIIDPNNIYGGGFEEYIYAVEECGDGDLIPDEIRLNPTNVGSLPLEEQASLEQLATAEKLNEIIKE